MSFGDIAKRIAELWKAATPEEKAPFEADAAQDKVTASPALALAVCADAQSKSKRVWMGIGASRSVYCWQQHTSKHMQGHAPGIRPLLSHRPVQIRYKSEMAAYKAKLAGKEPATADGEEADDADEDADGGAAEDAADAGAADGADADDADRGADGSQEVKQGGGQEEVRDEPIEDLLHESD